MGERHSKSSFGRREFLRRAGAVAGAAVLAGCRPPAPTPEPQIVKETVEVREVITATPAALSPGRLTIWINWGGVYQEAIQQIVAAFRVKYPQIEVELLPSQSDTEGRTKFLASVVAGNPPDLFTTHAYDGYMYTHRDVLQPLDDYMAQSTVKAEDFFESQLKQYMKDGKIYGIPSIEGAAGQAMVWNKAHFEEVGLDPEVGPATHDEISEFAKKLDRKDNAGNIVRLGFDPRDGRGWSLIDWWFQRDWYNPDTGKLNVNTPNMKWGADWVTSFATRIGPENMTSFRQENDTYTGSEKSGFVRGAQSMIMTGYYVAGQLAQLAPDLKFGVTWVPTPDKKKVTTMRGWFWVMPKGCPNPEGAWKFIEHATSVEAAFTLLNVAGGYPSYKPFLKVADFSKIPGMQWFVDSPFTADEIYIAPPFPISTDELDNRINAGLDNMAFGKMTAEQVLSQAQDEVQKLIDQELQRAQ